MNRRTLLRTAGSGLAMSLAGCLTRMNRNSSPTGLSVTDIGVYKAVTYESTMGSGGVLAPADRQFVVASVRNGSERDGSAFRFETESESWTPGLPETRGARNYAVAGREGGPVGSPMAGEQQFLAFTVPSPLSATEPRIRVADLSGGEWQLPESAGERLAAPSPAFELTALTAPAEVSQGESISITLTVENVSETDGRLLAAVYWPTNLIADDDESQIIEQQVAAGEQTTATVEIDTEYTADEDGPVALTVDGHVATRRSIRVLDTGRSE